jgi:hypothetical protein
MPAHDQPLNLAKQAPAAYGTALVIYYGPEDFLSVL